MLFALVRAAYEFGGDRFQKEASLLGKPFHMTMLFKRSSTATNKRTTNRVGLRTDAVLLFLSWIIALDANARVSCTTMNS